MLLEVNNVVKSFGGIKATQDISISIDTNKIISIIGPNGAGKTTLFNIITGICKPDSGEIWFDSKNVTGVPLYNITRLGMARTFQNIRLFKGLSVLENVMVSRDTVAKYNIFDSLVASPRKRKVDKKNREECMQYLELVGLDSLKDEACDNLPYGLQRKLELARALATEPKLLLLDEPAAGLNPSEIQDYIRLIANLRCEHNYAILIIEHRMQVVNQLSDWIYVLNFGQMLAQGAPREIQGNDDVIKAYIGEED